MILQENTNKQPLLTLQQRFDQLIERLESIEPEHVNVEDIDRLLELIDDIEKKISEAK